AEDGIRDFHVTGVQTCALPISIRFKEALVEAGLTDEDLNWLNKNNWLVICGDNIDRGPDSKQVIEMLIKLVESGRVFCLVGNHRSEERRVGKESGSRGATRHEE